MKPWLRLTLVAMTIGGGFSGVVRTMQSFSRLSTQELVIAFIFIGLYAGVTASGLLFVHDPTRSGPLVAALILQVPWISSSLIVYKFAAGLGVCASVGSTGNASRVEAGLFWEFMLGSRWRCDLGEENPLRVGVNVAALALLLLLWRARQPASQLIP